VFIHIIVVNYQNFIRPQLKSLDFWKESPAGIVHVIDAGSRISQARLSDSDVVMYDVGKRAEIPSFADTLNYGSFEPSQRYAISLFHLLDGCKFMYHNLGN